MTIYKVSYVIIGNDNPGAIMNQEQMPVKGETVCIRNELFEVLEVLELVPPPLYGLSNFRLNQAVCAIPPVIKHVY
jgi:hypothetical protein